MSTGELENSNSIKCVTITDYMGRTRNEVNGKRISCIAPIAEFDKTSPSIQEDVFIIEDKTPPTEAIDDLEMDEADVDDE